MKIIVQGSLRNNKFDLDTEVLVPVQDPRKKKQLVPYITLLEVNPSEYIPNRPDNF